MVTNWLAKRRDELKLNQEELVARLQTQGFDISRSTLSHWERERYTPPLHDRAFRRALANALRVSVPRLLEMAGYEVVDKGYSDAGERAASIIDQLPPDKRALALGILEQLLEKS